jgi:hypothetical protein
MLRIFQSVFMLILCLTLACSQEKNNYSVETADTPENRAKLTEKYFKLVPFEKVMNDMGTEMASRMPQGSKEKFLSYWKSFITAERISEIERVAKKSFTKHMTVKELQAFIRFMEDPAGQSAMNKMKFYMADIMPLMQKYTIEAAQTFHANQQ